MAPLPKNLDDAFGLIESRTNLEKGHPPGNPNRTYRLDRMRALTTLFGSPQDRIRVVHVAGSKGKGSTSAYIGALLAAAGRKVGVYSSPHLLDYRERMQILNEPFPETRALAIARRIETVLSEHPPLPGDGEATTFEILTLMALLLFVDCGCDTAVLETGLGGRLDATNIVTNPEAVVLTPIEREHTEILGDTLTAIAGEKAGIMKRNCPVWSAPQHPDAADVFNTHAEELACSLNVLTDHLVSVNPEPHQGGIETEGPLQWKWILKWSDKPEMPLALAMAGEIQAWNAALALNVVKDLEPQLSGEDAVRALSSVALPGRSQWVSRNPPIMLDGAHTSRSIHMLREAFLPLAGENPILVFGSVLDKDHQAMADILAPFFGQVVVTTPGTFKPSDPSSVAQAFRRRYCDVHLLPDPQEAWAEALVLSRGKRGILVTGSFYMAGEIAKILSSSDSR